MHLQSQNPVIQQNAIALINALFLKADNSKRKAIAATLSSKQVRNVILTNVIQSTSEQVIICMLDGFILDYGWVVIWKSIELCASLE
jgi:hypothetical protein